MFLTALTQRDRLFDVTTRWLSGHVEPEDATFLTEAFLIDHTITRPAIEELLRDVMRPYTEGPVHLQRLHTKGAVREMMIEGLRAPSHRAQELFSTYRKRSEAFFPTTPVDMHAVTQADGELAAMVRLKRVFRIADKATRKVIDRLEREIRRIVVYQETDERLGRGRGAALLAERVCEGFATGSLAFRPRELQIDDVIGAKIIIEESQIPRVEDAIREHPETISLRRSEHSGIYNDVHLDVMLRCPAKGPSVDRLRRLDWSRSSERGLDPARLVQDLPSYVETCAESFTIEIILTTKDELIESEFGHGLHEERIIRQRTAPRFTSQLATNVGLAALYPMLVAVSPTAEISDVPITMSGRHLPDAIVGSLGQLFGLDLG